MKIQLKKSLKRTVLASLVLANISSAATLEQPWLRSHLPEKITAYARIPHPLFVFADAQTPLQPMYENPEYSEQVIAVQGAILGKLKELGVDKKSRLAIETLFSHVRAPIEIAIPGDLSMKKMPTVLLATKFDYESTDDLEAALLVFFKKAPLDVIPADGDTGVINQKNGATMGAYSYDPKSGKLLIVVGENPDEFTSLLTAQDSEKSPIARAESLIDESGQGLLVVLKPTPELFKMIPSKPRERELIERLKINQIKEIAFGFGVANKQAKIKAYIDMPDDGLRKLIPAYPLPDDINYYGHLDTAVSFSLPNPATIEAMYPLLLDASDEKYTKFKEEFKEKTGIDFNQIMTVLGRTFIYMSDDNGGYFVTDAGFETELKKLVKLLKEKGTAITMSETEVAGKTLNHLDITTAFEKYDAKTKLSLAASNNHYYWIKEGEAVFVSDLPQPLLARGEGENKASLLTGAYPIASNDAKETFFSAVFNTRNLSQKAYYQNLRIMTALSDVAGVPFDVKAFPTANTLNFARYGAAGIRISNGGDLLSVELATENGMIDALNTPAMPMIAVTGILAAIAVPAYQDYIKKSKITRIYGTAQNLKNDVESAIIDGKSLDTLDSEQFTDQINNIRMLEMVRNVQIVQGKIHISLNMSSHGTRTISLIPNIVSEKNASGEKQNEVSEWVCEGGDIKASYLPYECR